MMPGTKPFTHSHSFSSQHNLLGTYYRHYLHLTDKETEAHTGQCLAQAHSAGSAKPGLHSASGFFDARGALGSPEEPGEICLLQRFG